MCSRMRGWLARLVAAVVLASAVSSSFAFVPPEYNGKANVAVGSVIREKVTSWGLSPSDPRVGATFAGVGTFVAGVAASVATGAVVTIGWPAVLIGAGVYGVAAGAVVLAQDGAMNWLFGSDGSITSKSGPDPVQVAAGAPQALWCSNGGACAVDRAAACNYSPSYTDGNGNHNYYSFDFSLSRCLHYTVYPDGSKNYGYTGDGVFTGCPGIGLSPVNGVCPASNFPPPDTVLYHDAGTAVQAVPNDEALKPISSQMLADAVNTAWKGMSASGNGIPWSASDPVTAADVDAWRAANPSLVPTVGDFAAPVESPAGKVEMNPEVAGGAQTQTAPATQGQGQQVDLGADPNLGAPSLEPIPTAQQILGPLLSLMPDLKNFVMPSHTAVCPTGSFMAFGQNYVFDAHCALFENNRALLEGAMLLVWSVMSVLIVLRA